MKRVLAQCTKELAQFRRDRLTVALAFVLPLAILLIYGFAIRYYVVLTRDAFVRGTGWIGVWYIPMAIALIGFVLFLVATRIIRRMQLSN